MKIFLIGMPGSGKTTLGQRLAAAMMLPFVDLDEEIEKQEGKRIAEIFSGQGEDYFRRIESDLLKNWAAKSESFVMATGGGAPCFFEGMSVIKASGISVFIDVDPETLAQRMAQDNTRPLLAVHGEDQLRRNLELLFQKREPIYRQAHFHLVKPTVEEILKALHIRK